MNRYLILVTALFFFTCKKEHQANYPTEDAMIREARVFFEKNYPPAGAFPTAANGVGFRGLPRFEARQPDWNNAYRVLVGGFEMVMVPVNYTKDFLVASGFSGGRLYSASNITRLCVFRDENRNLALAMLSFLPDSSFSPGRSFSGVITVDAWTGERGSKYKLDGHGGILEAAGDSLPVAAMVRGQSVSEADGIVNEVCYTIYGYNYSADDPDGGEYWSETVGCDYVAIGIDGGYGSGGGSLGPAAVAAAGASTATSGPAIQPVKTVVITGGTNIIGNITDYDKCFTNIAGNGHVYTVTVCVDQPVPGTRQAWGISIAGAAGSSGGSNPIDVGHVFLIFTETSGLSTVKRNIGFYPQGSVTPASPSDQGQLNDDDQHDYNVSLTISVTNSQFFNMLSYIQSNANDMYNLNSLNCTTFALRTLLAGNIILPSTIGNWSGGSGNDPGDFGEDILSLSLNSSMSRNTTYSSHPNLGNCN